MKPVFRRVRASADVDAAVAYYLEAAGPQVAGAFLEEWHAALGHIGLHPGTGSLRYAWLLPQGQLRFWLLGRFPHAVFYVEHEDRVEVLRLLHQSMDIPAHLLNESEPS